MSSDLKPGDRINITIEDAEIVNILPMTTKISYGGSLTGIIPSHHPKVTVTRAIPKPRAGDVWRLSGGGVVYILHTPGNDLDVYSAATGETRPLRSHSLFPIGGTDFTGAELLFRLPTAGSGLK